MIPLFKSHYSIGKSILTLSSETEEGAADSIINIAIDNNLKNLVLVEDSLVGFLEAHTACAKNNLNLIFGLRMDCCEDVNVAEKKDCHKIIIFAKNKKGCARLNSIYSHSFVKNGGVIDFNVLKEMWSEPDLKLCIPFYDSFIFCNLFTFKSFVPDFSFTAPTFFLESNGLPFDIPLRKKVNSFIEANNYRSEVCQSIYYKNKEDLSSFITYKLICSRKNFAGRSILLEKPNLAHLGSDEFCWESYLEKNEIS